VKQQIRWKKSFIRNLFFTGRFYWRRVLAPAFIYYAHAAFILATPFMVVRYLVYLPLSGDLSLAGVYVGGVFTKGLVWALAYKAKNPGCGRWLYRPFMSLMSTFVFAALLPYAALTIRRQVWARLPDGDAAGSDVSRRGAGPEGSRDRDVLVRPQPSVAS
jgi:hypothetical protein